MPVVSTPTADRSALPASGVVAPLVHTQKRTEVETAECPQWVESGPRHGPTGAVLMRIQPLLVGSAQLWRSHVSMGIIAFAAEHEPEVLELSLRAWAPVFDGMKPAVQPYVYRAFYPEGWRARQSADIREFLRIEGRDAWVAVDAGSVVGWVGVRLHPADKMGEIYILAVDPDHQRQGVASALMEHAMAEMRKAGMDIVMVETGDDPGHAPSRATYERAGFQRWPVARYFRQL